MLSYLLLSLFQGLNIVSFLANGVLASEQVPLGESTVTAKRPNVVFILTDDQDLHMDSLEYMPYLQKHLVSEGTFYQRHFCTIALCCPSRVSLWTGKAAHNTNVTDVKPPYGGYPKFISQGLNDAYLPIWLQEAGYNTYYVGKLFNAHTIDNYGSPFPAGFNGSEFLLDPYTYQFLNAHFQRNRDAPVSYAGDYSTDVVAKKSFAFLEDAIAAKDPFFLTIAPTAPHSNVEWEQDSDGNFDLGSVRTTAPISAKRHEHLFPNAVVPRTPNFNPDTPSGVSWVSSLPKHNQTNIDSNDYFYRSRLRALQAVDEIIDELVERLDSHGILEDTYIIYSTDNGYHIGQHRLQPGKECGFETDINIPLIVRGPGVPKGQVTDIVTSHTDLAPTFMDIVGGKLRKDFDGSPIPLTAKSLEAPKASRHEHVGIEFWGFALFEGEFGAGHYWNNTYKGLRVIGNGYNLYYSVWCSGEHELYNLNTDPYELQNIYPSPHIPYSSAAPTTTSITINSRFVPLTRLLPRLDTLTMILKTCKGRTCTHPWELLHPDGDVQDLLEALNPKFDRFYAVEQERVEFKRCEQGYIEDAEGPEGVKVYEGDDEEDKRTAETIDWYAAGEGMWGTWT